MCDPVIQEAIETNLKTLGHETVLMPDGSDSFVVSAKNRVSNIAFVDETSLAQTLDYPDLYKILVTHSDNAESAFTTGVDDCLLTPFNPVDLKLRLRTAIRTIELIEELKLTKQELKEHSTHDRLTGLPNRLSFSDRLTQEIARAKENNTPLSVLFIDLDDFHLINGAIGRSEADGILQQVGARLQECTQESGYIARMGGDQFAVALTELSTSEDDSKVAEAVKSALKTPFEANGKSVTVTASIGISSFPKNGTDSESLVISAETGMFLAKSEGGNCWAFCKKTSAPTSIGAPLATALHEALKHGEFVPFYQARVDLRSGKVLGAEALLRWKRPDIGLVPPGEFIPFAEESGLIVPITEQMLIDACNQNQRWLCSGLIPMNVAVNISPSHLTNKRLITSVKQALDASGLDPQHLSLEITEKSLLCDPATAETTLREVKEMGVKILLDDFGTGHSSLAFLKRFPVDAVKIDLSFVKSITTDPDDAAVAGAIIGMAHNMKLKVVAEGVETVEQLEFLQSLNCDEMQGYFISHPVGAEDFTHLLWSSRQGTSHRFGYVA